MMNVPITVFNCQKKNYDNFFFNFQVVKKHVDGWKKGNGKKKKGQTGKKGKMGKRWLNKKK